MTQVFISYKSEYWLEAIKLRDAVRSWGYGTWLDQDDISAGNYWRDEIDSGLEGSDVIVGAVTQEALGSREVIAEWNHAYSNRHKRLYLLMLQDVKLPYWLQTVQYIDATRDFDAALAELRAALAAPATDAQQPSVPAPTSRSRQPRGEKFIKPRMPDNKPQRQRRRVALGIGAVILLFAFITLFLDNRALTMASFAAGFIPAVLQLMSEATSRKPKEKLDDATLNRRNMLLQVYDAWIEGALEQNVSGEAFELDTTLQPSALLKHPKYPDYPVQGSSIDIAKIFDDMVGELLILGAPGSGKTVLLLQLTEQLLIVAQEHADAPIPVVLNLSSWGDKQPG